MIINESNGEIINSKKVYIHDDILTLLQFSRLDKKMILNFNKYNSCDEYKICFFNVLGFEMSSCDFWGESECLFDFEYVKQSERVIIPKLLKEWDTVPVLVSPINYENFIEVLFTFSSGDKLRIACEEIEIT